MTGEPAETMWEGQFLAMKRQGRWEYVSRTRGVRAVVILAAHEDCWLLVEQDRVPLGRRCLELPAGLVGDEAEDDTIEKAARRELVEETGFSAERIDVVGEFQSSPGMVSESFTLVRAHGLERVGPGGGVGGEDIALHLVPRGELPAFVAAKRAEGVAIDVRLLLLLAPTIV